MGECKSLSATFDRVCHCELFVAVLMLLTDVICSHFNQATSGAHCLRHTAGFADMLLRVTSVYVNID